jgi:hypothetical protein
VNRSNRSKADSSLSESMFVGMDVHNNYLQIAVVDENGKVLDNSRVDNDLSKISEYFDCLDNRKSTNIVMESSGLWYDINDHLTKRHLDVRLSNPAKTRAIASAKIKTDKLDAIKLADLLRGGYIAECYIPSRRTMELREDKIVVLLLDIILDLQIDELLRFRKVERHGEGVANLLTAEESKKSIEMAMTGWKVRSELSNKIGKGRYVIAEYERIKRITMPFGEDYLLYLTTEQANHLNIINRIRKLEAGLKYSFS